MNKTDARRMACRTTANLIRDFLVRTSKHGAGRYGLPERDEERLQDQLEILEGQLRDKGQKRRTW